MVSLTHEQEAVAHDILIDNKCCLVTAIPGAGKTTLAIEFATRAPDQNVLVITYNKVLESALTKKATEEGIHNLRAATIHGLLAKQSGMPCMDDGSMLHILDSGATIKPLVESIVIIDEAQDLRPTLIEALRAILTNRENNSLSLMVCGDVHQMLYDFPSLGDDRADAKFLLNAPEHFGFASPGREWTNRVFTQSFRLTPNISTFVNAIWDRPDQIVGANNRVPNLPVNYCFCDAYGDEMLGYIHDSIEQYGRENVVLIAHSTKNRTPIISAANKLLAPTYTKTTGAGDDDELRNKVHVLTACASKGAEYRCVWFIGFDVFAADRMITKNQVCVGLSRASAELNIVHHHKSHIYPIGGDLAKTDATYELIRTLAERGVIRARYLPKPQKSPLFIGGGVTDISVSDCMRINIRDLLDIKRSLVHSLTDTTIEVDKSKLDYTCGRSFRGNFYEVSDLFGDAIPFAFQASRGVPPPAIMRNIMGARIRHSRVLSENGTKMYAHKDLLYATKNDEFTSSAPAWEGGLTLEQFKEHTDGHLSRGAYSIRMFERDCFASAIHLKDWRKVCADDGGLVASRAPEIWFYLAEACRARNGDLNRYRYMGRTTNSYKWNAAELLTESTRILDSMVPQGGLFEREISFASGGGLPTLRGVVDWIDTSIATLFEFKFCSCLSEEHRFQTAVYTAMLAAELGRTATGVLLNVRTGQIERYVVEPDAARAHLPRVVRIVTNQPAPTQATLMQTS